MNCGRKQRDPRITAWFAASVVLLVGISPNFADQTNHAPITMTQFSGRVYDGLVGDESSPLIDVTVELYCSANHAVLGTRITTTTTDPAGWYGLTTDASCEFFNILQIDLPGYESEGATTVGGEVINDHWIEYSSPLGGVTLTGNKFWDRQADPSPGGWAGFWPTGWVGDQTVTCGIEVLDAGSGLDPSTAEYSHSSDGGAGWSSWSPADC